MSYLDSVRVLIAGLTAERDSARNVAVRLEQEVAALRHVLAVLGYDSKDFEVGP